MGFVKNLADSVLYTVVFYLFLGLLIGIHGFSIPAIAFTFPAVITAIIYMYVLIANYRIKTGENAKS